jgi:hypothetical protein
VGELTYIGLKTVLRGCSDEARRGQFPQPHDYFKDILKEARMAGHILMEQHIELPTLKPAVANINYFPG